MKPENLNYFERFSERSLLLLDEAKRAGKKVFGVYCTFAPVELIYAAGAIPVGLCGKKETPIPEAEKTLPANLCPLIKSSYGYAVTDTCPFFAASDFLIGETTCDGKKKMFELLGRLKPLFLLHLPPSCKGTDLLEFWLGEIRRFQGFVEEQTGHSLTEEALRRHIRIQNRKREGLKKIAYLAADDPIPLSGLEMLAALESSNFSVNQEEYLRGLDDLYTAAAALKNQGISAAPPDSPRILLTGCPVGKGSEKVLRIIEESGGLVVCMENCTGIKSFDRLVDENGEDPCRAIAWRYLQTPCSCLTPNAGRLDLIGRLIKDFRIQGVVDLTWSCCLTYSVEARLVQEFLEKIGPIPYLHLETDYSSWDVEQLKTRVEAFLEVVRSH